MIPDFSSNAGSLRQRYHVSIPQAVAPDYDIIPQSTIKVTRHKTKEASPIHSFGKRSNLNFFFSFIARRIFQEVENHYALAQGEPKVTGTNHTYTVINVPI